MSPWLRPENARLLLFIPASPDNNHPSHKADLRFSSDPLNTRCYPVHLFTIVPLNCEKKKKKPILLECLIGFVFHKSSVYGSLRGICDKLTLTVDILEIIKRIGLHTFIMPALNDTLLWGERLTSKLLCQYFFLWTIFCSLKKRLCVKIKKKQKKKLDGGVWKRYESPCGVRQQHWKNWFARVWQIPQRLYQIQTGPGH